MKNSSHGEGRVDTDLELLTFYSFLCHFSEICWRFAGCCPKNDHVGLIRQHPSLGSFSNKSWFRNVSQCLELKNDAWPTLELQWGGKERNNNHLVRNYMNQVSVLHDVLRQQRLSRSPGNAGKLLSTVSQNMQLAQHNILQPDKIIFPYLHYWFIIIIWLPHQDQREVWGTQTHVLFPEKHTPSFRWEFGWKAAICEPLLWLLALSCSFCCTSKSFNTQVFLDTKSEQHKNERMETQMKNSIAFTEKNEAIIKGTRGK